MECLCLRKDLDFESREIRVRSGKGDHDRVTMLPEAAIDPLLGHLDRVRRQHQAALERGAGAAPLPAALARKYPNAARQWPWQFAFPASRDCRDPRTGALVVSTYIRPRSNVKFTPPSSPPESANQPAAIHSATR